MAFFHSAGKTLVSIDIDLLKMLHSEPAMMGPAVFRSLTEILSCPVALLVKRDLKISSISFAEIFLNRNVVFVLDTFGNSGGVGAVVKISASQS